ncbi:beta-1,3-glucan-binding protein-like isoform X2 [Prorops nasuta]|uniref:beta-1,3-glucan-binding protein-like isoform X2 n=1 Tax=Prorops nasuta TaxID=863751 RepID=UPI0034CF96A2
MMQNNKLILFCFLSILQYPQIILPIECYNISRPTIEILRPRGLRASIPDESGVRLFGFHANVNKGIGTSEQGTIFGTSFRATKNRWTIENLSSNLRPEDVLYFRIYVQANGEGYTLENQQCTIKGNEDLCIFDNSNSSSNNVLTVDDNARQLMFEENFESLNFSIWSREIKIPLAPDYEFCVYHNDAHTDLIQIEKGALKIKPIILDSRYGENSTTFGRLQLSNCTSPIHEECLRQATGFSILPPIISARLTTKDSFNFQYGKIEIRAKFPEGDWLYPEMWLEPKYNVYGRNGYVSGRIVLGLARGNEILLDTGNSMEKFDSRKLEFGFRSGAVPDVYEKIVSKTQNSRWTKDYHIYGTVWNSEGFIFSVDDREVGRLKPESENWLRNSTKSSNFKNAPFDQEFYLTVGIGVGGLRTFPDKLISAGYEKPWKNKGAKAMMKFWHMKNTWLPSWTREEGEKTSFEIDYVRIWSLNH